MPKAWVQELFEDKVGLQVAPLIDCTFLLLIYFMVSASLKRSEAELGITLPGSIAQSQTTQMPDEQMIEVEADGRILLNGMVYGDKGGKDLSELVTLLVRYRLASEAARTKALITIQGADEARHERIVDVMNACAQAEIKNVTFGMGGE